MARKKAYRLVLCANNQGYPASLEVRKVYKALPDASAEASGFVRVVDESGEDYLYPRSRFVPVVATCAVAKVLHLTTARSRMKPKSRVATKNPGKLVRP